MQTAKEVRKRYNSGMFVSMSIYVVLLFASVYYLRHNDAGNHIKILLALLTSAPIGASIYVFIRYLKECDEFLRNQLSEVFIIAAAVTFFMCATWGFLEGFASFPRFEMYWVYIVFWGVFGVISMLRKIC